MCAPWVIIAHLVQQFQYLVKQAHIALIQAGPLANSVQQVTIVKEIQRILQQTHAHLVIIALQVCKDSSVLLNILLLFNNWNFG